MPRRLFEVDAGGVDQILLGQSVCFAVSGTLDAHHFVEKRAHSCDDLVAGSEPVEARTLQTELEGVGSFIVVHWTPSRIQSECDAQLPG